MINFAIFLVSNNIDILITNHYGYMVLYKVFYETPNSRTGFSAFELSDYYCLSLVFFTTFSKSHQKIQN